MAVEISEMRPSDWPDVTLLLDTITNQPLETQQTQDTPKPSGDTPPPPETTSSTKKASISLFDNVLSLIARENNQLVGVILCQRDGTLGYLHNLTLAASHQTVDLDKALIDRALGKLNARGSNKTRINLPDGPEHAPFWDAVKWSNIQELDSDPVRSSAVTERLAAGHYSVPSDNQEQEILDTPQAPTPEEAVSEQAA